jgi:hypothetical protein
LKTEGKYPDLEGEMLYEVTPWLEVPFDTEHSSKPYGVEERLKQLEEGSDPRIFKMHVLWEEIPRQQAPASKVIAIFRDMREIPYSMYNHNQVMRAGTGMFANGVVPSFEDFFDSWIEKTPFYLKHLKSMWPLRNHPNVHFVQYEKLKANTLEETKKLIQFLEWNTSEEGIKRAIKLSSFDSMKKAEKDIYFRGNCFDAEKSFIREGCVGKNRRQLSKNMEKRLVKAAEDAGLDDEQMAFTFSQGGVKDIQ